MTKRKPAWAAPKLHTVGARRGQSSLVARVQLAGRWLEDAGFRQGTQYTVQRLEDGLLLRTLPYATTAETATTPSTPELSYEPWLVRLRLEHVPGAPREPHYVNGPADAYALLRGLAFADRENLATLLLGARNQVLGVDLTSVGSLNAAGVEPREVYKAAIHANSASIVLAHNHPSGDPEPSDDDRRLTRRIASAGEVIGIRLLDHLVIAPDAYVSLRERGYL
jgi:DNA repair protein RadC